MPKLLSAISVMIIALSFSASNVFAQSSKSGKSSKKILIVDDSKTVRQQLSAALQQASYTVIEASNGKDAQDKIKADPSIALVICDINMPKMNGFELLEWAKADVKYTSIPFLMLSTESNQAFSARAKKLGAKGIMIKPFKSNLIVSAADKLTN